MPIFINLLWALFAPVSVYSFNLIIEKWKWAKKKKITAPDLATPLLFIGLNSLSKNAFSNSVLPYFLISVLLLGMAITGFMAYIYGEINYKKFIKLFWRIIFVFTVFIYLIFIIANFIVAI
ncbi:MAG: DUF3397 domain-containing protein [Lactobacillales bacterium]|nr:DUF3397 domain-containing protein [Lactobacillales bacterium]